MTDKFIIPPEKMVFIPLGGSSELGMNFFAFLSVKKSGLGSKASIPGRFSSGKPMPQSTKIHLS